MLAVFVSSEQDRHSPSSGMMDDSLLGPFSDANCTGLSCVAALLVICEEISKRRSYYPHVCVVTPVQPQVVHRCLVLLYCSDIWVRLAAVLVVVCEEISKHQISHDVRQSRC